jgi:GTP-binding protein
MPNPVQDSSMKPIVVIVGRPNVGKSTLFNRISRERRSLVNDQPGVTRDRLYNEVHWHGKPFILVDTGGFEPSSEEPLLVQMREQTELAIEEATLILFLLDIRDGLTPSDREAAQRLRSTSKPVFYVVNKADGERLDPQAMEFYELGVDHLHLISSKHGRGVSDLLDAVVEACRAVEKPPAAGVEDGIRIAVVGRPNVGKSSLVNFLAGHPRTLVSSAPGTTHDAVDTQVRWHGKSFVLVDTAGIRRKARVRVPLEKYCAIKALGSIERSDVALLLLDATEGVTDQDARIGSYIVERGRGCIVLLNKWDLVEKDHRTHARHIREIQNALPHLNFAPVLTVSALAGQRLGRVLGLVEQVYAACGRRIATAQVNERLQVWVKEHPPPMHKGRRIKIHYGTQTGVHPPTFVLFANDPRGVNTRYRRYLMRRIREEFDFAGAPLRIYAKAKKMLE